MKKRTITGALIGLAGASLILVACSAMADQTPQLIPGVVFIIVGVLIGILGSEVYIA